MTSIHSITNLWLLFDNWYKFVSVNTLFLLSMLRKKEKKTLTRLFLLGIGAPIGLDRFYEGDITGGFLAILGFVIALVTVVGLLVWIFPFISKTFRLLREFEEAED